MFGNVSLVSTPMAGLRQLLVTVQTRSIYEQRRFSRPPSAVIIVLEQERSPEVPVFRQQFRDHIDD
jgi:hypothetical protein